MALTISLREGQDFFVGNEQFFVEKIISEHEFMLRGACKDSGLKHVTNARSCEILPNVFVSAGKPSRPDTVSIAIDAPREILILRGKLVRNPLRVRGKGTLGQYQRAKRNGQAK